MFDGTGRPPFRSDVGVRDERTKSFLADELEAWNGTVPGLDWNWTTVGEYLQRIDDHGVSPNVAVLAPHGTIRLNVVGHDDRPATADELTAMQAQVAGALDDGAMGLSTGLTYAPAQFADTDELVALTSAMSGGYFAPHLRTYGKDVLGATQEALEVGRRAGVPVHLTHAQLPFPENRSRAHEFLSLIDGGTRRGPGCDHG